MGQYLRTVGCSASGEAGVKVRVGGGGHRVRNVGVGMRGKKDRSNRKSLVFYSEEMVDYCGCGAVRSVSSFNSHHESSLAGDMQGAGR